jgi:hypothetical protein
LKDEDHKGFPFLILPYGETTNCYHFKSVKKLENPCFKGGGMFSLPGIYRGVGLLGDFKDLKIQFLPLGKD